MATGNFSHRSIRSTSSSTPSTPRTPTPNAFSFLNSRPAKPDRAREDIFLKHRKRRAEDVWDHFRKPQEDEDKRGKDGQSLMYCKICNGRWSTAITTNARGHLANKHQIYIEVGEPKGKKTRQLALDISFQNATDKLAQRDSFDLREKLRNAIDRDAFYEAQIQLITRRRMAFNCVEWAEYQALLMSINPEVESLLVESHSSIPIHIERSFRKHYGTVKGRLQSARSQIHYSIDLWKSPNRKSFLGICAQFVDSEYVLRKALLALPQCRFSHSGETMAAHILEAIKAYEITEKTGYIVGDNASSNDTCVAAIGRELVKLGIEFDGKKRRIRCCGHIINLSLEAFLFASTVEALEAAIEAAKEEADVTIVEALQEQLREKRGKKGKKKRAGDEAGWQSISALSNLHTIAVFIRSSSILSDEWEILAGKTLGIDNITRWNSWFNLIKTAVEKQAKLMIFCQNHHKELGTAVLSPQDWETLKMTLEFLQPFSQATLIQESKWSSLDQALWTMDVLFKHYEQAKDKYAHNRHIVNSINMGWYVLDKYYKSSDEAPAYTTALLLHPMRRKKYIDLNWEPSWCEPALKAAREVWEKYRDLPLQENINQTMNDDRELSEFDKLAQELDVTEDDGEDEFEKFVTASPHKITCSPLQWWCKEEQRLEYPRLHKMAIDILSIPPMSDEAERVFSGVRRTISWDRARLGAWIVEMTELLGNWNKNDLIRVLHVLAGEDDEVISLSATGGNDIDIVGGDSLSQ